MKQYSLIIFDFDGTLADSFGFFVSMLNVLAAEHGFARIDLAQVDTLRGLTPREIIERFNVPMWKVPKVALSFINRMHGHIGEIELFADVPEVLQRLKSRGAQLALVTSNARKNVLPVLGASAELFSQLDCGSSMFGKAPRLNKILRNAKVAPAEAIYIGDQPTDLEAARKVGIDFAAVSWGYATASSLQARGADIVLANVLELVRLAKA